VVFLNESVVPMQNHLKYTAQIIFIRNRHINHLKDGERFDALFESNNQPKNGWHFVFDDAFVLIRHHSDV
jgi:hypothetical protein